MFGWKFPHIPSPLTLYRRAHTWPRMPVLLTIALISLLTTTVAVAQSSLDYDLACRSVMSGGGGTMTGGFYGLTGALGMPVVPAKETDLDPTYSVRSTLYGVRAGFLPGYPSDASQPATIAAPEQSFVQRLPLINKVFRLVRGGC